MKLSPGVCTSKNWTLEDLAKEFSETDGGATWYLKFTCKFIVGQTQTQTLGEIVKKKRLSKSWFSQTHKPHKFLSSKT